MKGNRGRGLQFFCFAGGTSKTCSTFAKTFSQKTSWDQCGGTGLPIKLPIMSIPAKLSLRCKIIWVCHFLADPPKKDRQFLQGCQDVPGHVGASPQKARPKFGKRPHLTSQNPPPPSPTHPPKALQIHSLTLSIQVATSSPAPEPPFRPGPRCPSWQAPANCHSVAWRNLRVALRTV